MVGLGPENLIYIKYFMYVVYAGAIIYFVLYLIKFRHRAVIVEPRQGSLKVHIKRCKEVKDDDGSVNVYKFIGKYGDFLPPKQLERTYIWGGLIQANVFLLQKYGENQFAHVRYDSEAQKFYPLPSDIKTHLVNRMAKAKEDNKIKSFWREYGDSVIMITGIVMMMFGMYLLFGESVKSQALANDMLSRVPEITKAAIEACKETLSLR